MAAAGADPLAVRVRYGFGLRRPDRYASAMTAPVATYDLQVYRGDSLRFEMDFWNDSGKQDPHDLTQYSEIKMQVRREREQTPPVIRASLGDGLNLQGNQRLVVDIDKSKTDILSGFMSYDIEGEVTGGQRRTLVQGAFNLQGDVTRVAS